LLDSPLRPAASANRGNAAIRLGHRPEDRLKFADEDAKAFVEFIKTKEGGEFPAANIRQLLDSDAKRSDIIQGLNWLGRKAGNEDVVYIFFAGHGVVDSAGLSYLMPYEADIHAPNTAGIRADQFLEEINRRISAHHTVLFIDACHSGATVTNDGIARDGNSFTPGLIAAWENGLRSRPSVVMGFFSSESNERSWEDLSLRHGLFTYYLLEGLKGSADQDSNGTVESQELFRFLTDKVEARSRERFQRQTPVKSPRFDASFPLAFHRVVTPPPVSSRPPTTASASSCDEPGAPDLTIRVSGSRGPVGSAEVALIYGDGTYVYLVTDASGRACAKRLKERSITVFAAHERYAAYFKPADTVGSELTINLRSAPSTTGSIICKSTCHILGLDGRLNPILDSPTRRYLYADNIAINGGEIQPVEFELNQEVKLVDAEGKMYALKFISMIARISLIEYRLSW